VSREENKLQVMRSRKVPGSTFGDKETKGNIMAKLKGTPEEARMAKKLPAN